MPSSINKCASQGDRELRRLEFSMNYEAHRKEKGRLRKGSNRSRSVGAIINSMNGVHPYLEC